MHVLIRRRRKSAAALAVALLAATLGLVGLASPSGAAPGATMNLYQCAGTGLAAGQTLPFVLNVDADATPDPAFPDGVPVDVTGNVALTMAEAVVANWLAADQNALVVNANFEVVATNATGGPHPVSFAGSSTPLQGRTIFGVNTVDTSNVLNDPGGNFVPSDVGKFVAANPVSPPANFPTTVIIGFIDANNVEIADPATVTGATDIGIADAPLTDVNVGVDLGTYTTDGLDGDTVEVALGPGTQAMGVNQSDPAPNTDLFVVPQPLGVTVPFDAGCTIEWDGSGLSPIGFPPPANVATSDLLNQAPIMTTASRQAVAGLTQNFNLNAVDPNVPSQDIVSWADGPLTGDPECAGSNLSFVSQNAAGTTSTWEFDAAVSTTDYTCQVDFVLTNASAGTLGGGVSGPQTLTITVLSGDSTQQDVEITLNPGVLDLDQVADTIVFPDVFVDGTDQFSNAAINQLILSDGRGVPAPWTVTAQLDGPLVNSDPVLGAQPNGQIVESNMEIDPTACDRVAGNVGPVLQVLGGPGTLDNEVTLCSMSNGANGGSNLGQFTIDADLELFVPGSTFAGFYTSTITFLAF